MPETIICSSFRSLTAQDFVAPLEMDRYSPSNFQNFARTSDVNKYLKGKVFNVLNVHMNWLSLPSFEVFLSQKAFKKFAHSKWISCRSKFCSSIFQFPPQEGSQWLLLGNPVHALGAEGKAGAWWTCFMAALWISFNFEDFGYQWKPDSQPVESWYEKM